MGIPGSANPMLFGGVGAYQINQSLRFNSADSAHFDRTFASAGNRRTYTLSFWLKAGKLSGDQTIFMTPKGSGYCRIDLASSAARSINFLQWNGSSYDFELALSPNRLRDPSAWYHIIVAVDTTQSTASNRVKFYINGNLETALDSVSNVYPSQNYDTEFNTATAHYIGRSVTYGQAYLDGYLAEVNYVDGQQLTPSSFGETDTITGAWIPKKYSGSYGTNGFYLNFSDNSGTTSTTLGKDSSGNGNNWTPNNFSVTAGAGNDVLSDSPTNNWCTLNPIDKTDGGFGLKPDALSNGNLVDSSAYNSLSKGTIGVTSGKWYFEFTGWDSTSHKVGVALVPPTSSPLSNTDLKLLNYNGQYQSNAPTGTAGGTTYGGSISSTDIVGVAIDMDNRTIAWAVNNQWANGSGSWNQTYAASTKINLESTGGVTPCCLNGSSTGTARTFNFGQRAFAYTPPTGFKALNTANLPEPTIKKGGAHFNTVTYTGTGATQTVTGVGFQPDFVWAKSRTNAYSHQLYDAVRGAGKSLVSNLTGAENTVTYLNAFTSNGFTLDGDAGINASGASHVAWNWKANGAGSSNTAGTITSTVSANATAGFSIVTWTGTGADGSYGHGLGVQPSMIIHKRRDSTSDWHVWHKGLPTKSPTNDVIYLNLTNAQNGGNSNLFRLDPTSTLIYTGNAGSHNVNGATYVDYVFSEVAGYSKFGSYVGNGSSDGPFVYLGFKPALLIIKSSTSGENWHIKDSTRDTYNPIAATLLPNAANSELNLTNSIDLLSNGFKIRSNSWSGENSSNTFIYAAFAEHPFKYANAR